MRQKQTEFVISDAVGDVANNMTKKIEKAGIRTIWRT
jgi:hypothetical protein